MGKKSLISVLSVIISLGLITTDFTLAGGPKGKGKPQTTLFSTLAEANGEFDTFELTGDKIGPDNDQVYEIFNYRHNTRIRQDGDVEAVEFNVTNDLISPDVTAVTVRLWRVLPNNTFDLIGETENLYSALSGTGVQSVALSSPVTGIMEGDFTSIKITSTGTASLDEAIVLADCDTNKGEVYYTTSTAGSNFDWLQESSTAGKYVQVKVYMQPPVLVSIGHSNMAGRPAHYSYNEDTTVANILTRNSPETPIGSVVADQMGVTHQNMAHGGWTSTNVKDNYISDVVDLQPQYALVLTGMAEVINGSPSQYPGLKQTVLSNWQAIADYSQAAGIVLIANLIEPANYADNVQSAERDQWNTAIRDLLRNHPYHKSIRIVDPTRAIGQYRPGGWPYNYWDHKDGFAAADTLHWTTAGHQAWGEEIYRQLQSAPKRSKLKFETR